MLDKENNRSREFLRAKFCFFFFFFPQFVTTAILAYVDCEAAGTFANECLVAVLWHTFMGMMNEFRQIDGGDMTAADS